MSGDLPKSIYKYELQPQPSVGVQFVDLLTHAQILDCKMVGAHLFFWAIIDTTEPAARRAFRVYPTGGAMPMAPGRYIATVVERNDTGWGPAHLIWHVFEVPAC